MAELHAVAAAAAAATATSRNPPASPMRPCVRHEADLPINVLQFNMRHDWNSLLDTDGEIACLASVLWC